MRAFSRRRAPEEIILGRKKLESPFSLLLVFPNRYPVGMNNLGYLAVLRLVDRRRNWHSERAFWGDTRSREKNRTFSEFDLIAFSVSYEPDFLNIPDILRRAGLPEKAAARRRGPLVIAGGAAVGLNPEPLAPYVDAMVLGEGEGILGEFLDRIEGAAGENRSVLLEEVSRLRGVYVPSLMETPPPFPRPLRVPWEFPEGSRYLPREGVFAGRALIEVGRGCSRGCRFCAAGFIYRPPRYRPAPSIIEEALLYRGTTDRLGLVSPAVSDHPRLEEIVASLRQEGFRFAVSSLRAETASIFLLKALAAGGQNEVTLAPEAGSPRLRRAINKDIPEDLWRRVLEDAAAAGLRRAKLYFLLGLPGEDDSDRSGIIAFCRRLSGILPLRVSVSPFVPKPGTPFQGCPLVAPELLRRRMKQLQRELAPLPGVEVSLGSAREALLQAVLSRGGRGILELIEREGMSSAAASARPYEVLPPESFRRLTVDPPYLARERQKAEAGETTPACPAEGCRECGVCS